MDKESPDLIKQFGKRVLEYREKRNLNQDELAKMANTSPTTLSAIEAGKQATNLNLVHALAEALKVPASVLLSGDQMKITPEYALEILKEALQSSQRQVDELEAKLADPSLARIVETWGSLNQAERGTIANVAKSLSDAKLSSQSVDSMAKHKKSST